MSIDDLVVWSWSLTVAATGIALIYYVDVVAGSIPLIFGLVGMHVARTRFAHQGWSPF